MAFVRKNFERLGGGVQKLFAYAAGADAIATVAASAYFNGIETEVDAGDIVLVKGAANTTIDSIIITSARGVTPVTTATAEGITAT